MNNYMTALGLEDLDVISLLLERMEQTNYMGLDFSTVSYNPRLLRLLDMGQMIPVCARVWRSFLYRVVYYSGHRIHWLLRPQKRRFAKGLALTLSALAHLYVQTCQEEKPKLLASADRLTTFIKEKRLADYNLWAHDYDYRIHNVQITTQTPNLVTTAFVAKSFWDWWHATNETLYKEEFLRIVEDVIRVFPIMNYGRTACFMYTPNTRYYVHNANLLAAELLAKRFFIQNTEDLDLIKTTVSYSLDDFQRTGSFPYAGPPTENPAFDNFHTGYVLRSLKSIAQNVPQVADELGIQTILEKGITFYLDKFVRGGKIWRNSSRFIETHSLAEAILIRKEFEHLLGGGQKKELDDAIRTTMKKLWCPDGKFFINNVRYLPFGLGCLEDRTDMIRWSQAWMIYALAVNVEGE